MSKINFEKLYIMLLKNYIVFLSSDFICKLKSVVLLPIVSRYLGAVNYGIWTQLYGIINIISNIASLGLRNAAIRYLPGSEEKKLANDFFAVIFTVAFSNLVVATIIIAFSEVISNYFFGLPKDGIVIILSAFIIVTDGIKFLLYSYFKIIINAVSFLIVSIIESLIGIGFIVILSHTNYGIAGVAFTYLIVDTVTILVAFFILLKDNKIIFNSFSHLPRYLIYSLPTVPICVFNWVLIVSNRYFLGYYSSMKDVGVYSVAYNTSFFIVNLLLTPMWSILVPVISKMWNEDKKNEAIHLLEKLYFFQFIFVVPLVYSLIFFGKPMYTLVFSQEYKSGFELLPLVLLGLIIISFSYFNEIIMNLLEKTHTVLYIYLITAISNVIFNIILIPQYKMWGAVYGLVLSALILYGLNTVFAHRLLKPRYPILKCMKLVIIAGAIYSIASKIIVVNVVLSVVMSILCIAVYLWVCTIFGMFNWKEMYGILKKYISIT